MRPYDGQMRVVQVSAHYPPNFVSGGTLVPQRVARAMAARGHESFVYAGHLDAAREPLSTWQETDDEGVHVRWVVTTPWTGWDDPRNSHNPEVEADFRRWLDEIRPDVVHLHSLQTLGGSLVTAAKEHGAQVVLTMHDFWWYCARQFLVDRDMRPCGLVVDCNDCACQVDHGWAVDRLAALRPHIAAADVVLAPSRSAGRVLVANGVDERRLRVDENGVPASALLDGTPAGHRARAEGGPVRFLFAGGADPMKGLPVLLDAVRGLPADAAWELSLYGVGEQPPRVPAQVAAHGQYHPEELGAVLADHDVLVLPSVMRESHSILTREALTAGLAVVCTDTLGPEEAVEHGRNGLVVPAADPVALRAALEKLVADPALVRRLRGRGSASPLRPAEDQMAGLDALYAELHEARRAADGAAAHDAAVDALLHRVLFVVGINGAPLRYRAQLAAEALESEGARVDVRHYRDPALPELAALADAVVLYRVPATRQVVDLVESVRARPRPVPVVFDVDDLIFDPGLEGQVHGLSSLDEAEHALWWRGVARYRTTMELADVYVGSTQTLCEHAAEVTGLPTRQFRNGVGREAARLSEHVLRRSRSEGPLRLGYFSGTTTHDEDWSQIEPAVIRVLRERPGTELWLGGHLRPTPALREVEDRVRRLPMMPWQELTGVLRDVDVNLAPLVVGGVFNEAKSAIKWLEAALVETPTVASPTQPFVEAIDDGRTGLLARDVEEWRTALLRLLDDDAERARVGAQARREAVLTLSPHRQAAVYRSILRDAAEIARSGTRRVSTWEPVVDDEPFSAADAWVEPYPGTSAAHSGSPALGRLRAKATATVRVFRAGGAPAVARKVVAVASRRR
jgi:glycosyltransferase involved in cell wall biosynthesis